MTDKFRVLFFESNPADINLIKHELRSSGITFISRAVQSEKGYLKALLEFAPDIILSDYDLPQFNGAEALKLAKEHCPEIPFILVTGAVGEDRAIEILTSGATDYVMKNRLSRLSPAVLRALTEAEEHKIRRKAEAERDLLLNELEIKVQERTAELKAEIERREPTEKKYRKIFENSIEGFFQTTIEGQCLEVNPAFARILGFSSPRELIDSVKEVGHHYVDPQQRERLIQLLMEHDKAEGFEIEAFCKDGSKIWISINVHAVRDGAGNIKFLEGTIIDITKRKRVERELQESKHDLNRAQAVANTGSWRMNVQRNELLWSDETYRMFNIAKGSPMTYEAFMSAVHPEDREYVDRMWTAALRGEPYDIEHRIISCDTVKWVRERAELEFDDQGILLGGFGTVQDITERKSVEQRLQYEKLRLEIAQESAQAGTFEWDIQNRKTIWSSQLKALYGFAPGEFKGFEDWSGRVHPDDLRMSKKALLESLTTGKYDVDFRIIWPDRSLHWLAARGKVIYDEQGRPLYMTGINMDITERKRADELVRASTKKIETVLTKITDMYVSYDNQWRFVELNPMAEKLIGKTRQEVIGKVLWEVFPHLKDTEIHKNYLKSVRDKADMSFEAYSPVTGHWHEFYLYPAEEGLSVYLRDITERKQADAALRESQEKYKAIFENSSDAIMLLDMNRFIDCNSQTLRMYDFASKKEFLRNHPADLSPQIQPDGRKSFTAAMEHINNAFARGYERFEWMHIRRNGEAFLTDVVLSALTINNERVLQAIVRDITELKQTEEALKKSKEQLEFKVMERTAQLAEMNESLLAEIAGRKRTETKLRSAQSHLRAMASEVVLAEERSRQHFATDLHDSVVQTLGVAKLRAQLIEDQLPKKALPIVTDLQEMLSESIVQARSIMTEMSPPVLNELGIKSALEWLTEEIGTKHEINVHFKDRKNKEPLTLSRDIEVLLFQATRELLVNVVKHAKAQSATVNFSSHGQRVRIRVSDNGVGFNIKKTFQPNLNGGFGLYSIRERLRHVGGQLAIKSKPGQGTTVLITAPKEIEKGPARPQTRIFK